MNLYLLSRTDRIAGYDEVSSIVVAAETEDQATRTHPRTYAEWSAAQDRWVWKESFEPFLHTGLWPHPFNVNAKLIGTAAADVSAGVIQAC